MAKKKILIAQPIEWVEPPVTKEEALNPHVAPNGVWGGDGYDGGGELPDDLDIDRMIYPHDEGPEERKSRERRAKRKGDIQGFKEQAFQESREFELNKGSPLGEGGTLSVYDEEKEE
ncbi:MAG: hypothetical protein UY28_C0004G0044 [Candidatus Amesbacteria bacterium GW2011_GWB1_48_13]|uniref:Uncharacterized protein n=1 Tax=Candidatus Amesbacteria bacterium GW2011_GWB1_48_13 TaxID=1618362 RepID=A0A0G1UW74_9BACT|nr:MAG: hypothetical protein UY28_C0004G0044 [Candidatus Amesbacteria bacterium GW2011_GWB1_48_13]